MVIIGAGGLAKEILVALEWDDSLGELCLFDNKNADAMGMLYGRFRLIRSWDDLRDHFASANPEFVLGIGVPKVRSFCAEIATGLGGEMTSVISRHALIGNFGVRLAKGVCVLSHATITADVSVGEGTLINKAAILSHDVTVGSYCEVSPGAKILGKAKVGDRTEVGANAVILPGVSVGCDCRVGAGAVVTKDVQNGQSVAGVPARLLGNG
jgi:sugar O-acyltransferase (sialic acid O-acetyltransferase NeuD family)